MARRWSARKHLMRLLHCVVECKAAYLRRHERPADRQEYEAGARNSVYQDIALMFNDPGYVAPRIEVADSETDQALDNGRYTEDHDPEFKLSPDKAKYEMQRYLPALRHGRHRFEREN